MSTTVTILRISYVWFAGTSAAIITPHGSSAALARSSTYRESFAAAQAADPPTPFLPPWFSPRGQRYWRRYLEGHWPRDVTPTTAWRNVTPLRVSSLGLTDAPAKCRVSVDRYVYPHGIGAILEATWYDVAFTLDQAIAAGIAFRRKVGVIPGTDLPASLDDAVDRISNLEIDSLFGLDRALAPVPSDPMSICTVVRAEGESAQAVQGDAVHRRVHALASWSPLWDAAELPELAKATIEGGGEKPYLLYGTPRSRVMWYPAAFTRADPALHSLACYHRNLALASLQADGLAAMTTYGETLAADGTPLGGDNYDIVRLAATTLGRMYGGASSTYKSRSIVRQIDDHERRPDIDALFRRMHFPPLTASASGG